MVELLRGVESGDKVGGWDILDVPWCKKQRSKETAFGKKGGFFVVDWRKCQRKMLFGENSDRVCLEVFKVSITYLMRCDW